MNKNSEKSGQNRRDFENLDNIWRKGNFEIFGFTVHSTRKMNNFQIFGPTVDQNCEVDNFEFFGPTVDNYCVIDMLMSLVLFVFFRSWFENIFVVGKFRRIQKFLEKNKRKLQLINGKIWKLYFHCA